MNKTAQMSTVEGTDKGYERRSSSREGESVLDYFLSRERSD